jgi:phage baseplate assembly protein W
MDRQSAIVDFPATEIMIDSLGNIPVLTDQDALINCINLWICSFRGERLYRPNEGGIIADALLKPISDDRANQMRDELIDGLAYRFNPHVAVQTCTVTPDYERGCYNIEIRGYCPALKVSLYHNVSINSLAA